MFSGTLPGTWLSASLSESTNALNSAGNLIKKVLFPAEVLPIVSVLANMVNFFLGLPILILFLVIYQHLPNPWNLLWFPVVVAVQLVFTLALALAVAALSLHFRDLRASLSS